MSLNMFPNKLNPSVTEDVEFDTALPTGPAQGEGPYGSYNDDDGAGISGDLEVGEVRDLALTQLDEHTRHSTITEDLFPEAVAQEILDDALERAKLLLNPIISRSISERLTVGEFAQKAAAFADDLLETAVYEEIVDRADIGYDVKALTPKGLVELLDHFMEQNRGRVAQLEDALNDAFYIYWEGRNQSA